MPATKVEQHDDRNFMAPTVRVAAARSVRKYVNVTMMGSCSRGGSPTRGGQCGTFTDWVMRTVNTTG